ncbi:multiple epidermal growth factor-like domains protein 11 [Uloborus diversus]|uniref:multiple epidermal growth factor-like domains protein 11 n=1 Tax=Uloborus diversus TaxID=327109 RepID=UPI0024096AC8|nr:multiple epidermal growth factor-like domains protein 11 [Uloborus diversus]
MIYATEYYTEYEIKNETTAVCCDGFQEQNERCEPVCLKNCVFGECVAPDICKCNPGWSGNQCNDAVCSEGCKHGVCAHPEVCGCENGWYGKTCDQAVCTKGCIHGECIEPNNCKCNPGWSGNQCNDANCTIACDHGVCIASETCKCEDGWLGKTCNETCRKGFYGSECSHKCDCENFDGCDPTSGQCYCLDGFVGNRCTEQCPLGTHGRNCEEVCSCENGGKCNHIDGSCECSKGFVGIHCQDKCQAGFYGHNCSNECFCNTSTSKCDPISGSCKCFEGWIGETCDQRVESSMWGSQCDAACKIKCKSGSCDIVTGECICEPQGIQTNSSKLSGTLQDNVGVTAAIGGSVAFLVIVCIVLTVFLLWKRKRKREVPKTIPETSESLFPGRASKTESESDALKDTWTICTRGKNLYEKAKRESLAEMMAKEKPSTYFHGSSSNIYEDIIYKPVNLHPEDNVYENDGVRLNTQHNPTYDTPSLGTPTLPRKKKDAIDLHELIEYCDPKKFGNRVSALETYDTPKSSSTGAENMNSETQEELDGE